MSIFEMICKNMGSDGKLSVDFRLVEDADEIMFAPGALDGMEIYCLGLSEKKEEGQKVARLLKELCGKGETGKRRELSLKKKISRMICGTGFLYVSDIVTKELSSGDADYEKIYLYGTELAFEGKRIEEVKLGIALLGIASLADNKDVAEKLKSLGTYEEFTLYVARAFSECGLNNELFELAKKVHSWGKIHAVERLEPENEEIKQWIFYEGCHNSVGGKYLALTCAEKCNLYEILKKASLTYKEYKAVGAIMDGIADRKAEWDIIDYDYPKETLKLFLNHAEKMAEDIEDITVVGNVLSRICSKASPETVELEEICNRIMEPEKWVGVIFDAIKSGDCQKIAMAVKINELYDFDITDALYEAILKDPVKLGCHMHEISHNEEYVKNLVEYYEENLPVERMATGPGMRSSPIDYVDESYCLDAVLWSLHDYPDIGDKLIGCGLKMPARRVRSSAVRAINARITKDHTLSSELVNALKAAHRREFDVKLRNEMAAIIKKTYDVKR